MLTDTEVAETARQLLADELADLTLPDGLLAEVRSRHARARRARHATTAGLAVVTAAGLATITVAGTGVTGSSQAGRAAAADSRPPTGHGPANYQTIILDGLTVRLAPPLHARQVQAGTLTLDQAGQLVRLSLMLSGGRLPSAAVQVHGWPSPAYLLRSGARLSLYLPVPVASPQPHSLVLSATGLTRAELLKLAASITVAGKPGFLKSLPTR